MRIMFSFMGVPEQDWPRLKEWCGSRASLAWGRPTPEEALHHAQQMVLYRRYLRELVAAKADRPRATTSPARCWRSTTRTLDALAHEDIASILFSLSFAGHETTNNLIGNCVRRLLEVPERWDRLVERPDLIPGAVDEVLRFDPSVPVWRRVTTRPVTLGDVELPEGREALPLAGGRRPRRRRLPRPGHLRPRAPELAPDARLRARHPLLHRLRARPPRSDAGARGAHAPLPGSPARAARTGDPVPPQHLLPRPADPDGPGVTPRVTSDLLLVGSLPADSTEAAFRSGAAPLRRPRLRPAGRRDRPARRLGGLRARAARPAQPGRRRGRGDRLADRHPAPCLRDAGVRGARGRRRAALGQLAADRRRDRVLRGVHAPARRGRDPGRAALPDRAAVPVERAERVQGRLRARLPEGRRAASRTWSRASSCA